MKRIFAVLLVAALAYVARAEVEKENGVLVLTDDNFDEELKKHEFLLVEFYAPWCGHCKKLTPEFEQAAAKLAKNDPPLFVAKVDATAHPKVADRFSVKGYPTLYFFKNGDKQEFGGGRTADEIVQWILKKTGPSTAPLKACEDIEELVAANKVFTVFFGDESSDAFKAFESVANAEEKVPMKTSDDKSCAEKHGAKDLPAFIVFKNFDEKVAVYDGAWEKEEMAGFLSAASVPKLIEFGEDYIEAIFGKQKPCMFLFRANEDADTAWAKTFEQAASKLNGQLYFSYSGVKDGIQSRLAEFIGVTESDLPKIYILDPREGMNKYAYENNLNELTVDDLEKFVADWKAGKLGKTLKSDPIPEKNDEWVKVLVGKNFEDMVYNSGNDVLVEFYAPWCGHCKKLKPIYSELAKDLADVKDLTIAMMDSTTNEVDGVEIKGFPTIKFYPKGSKTAIEFEGDRTLQGFKDFLKKNASGMKDAAETKTEL